MGSLLRNVSRFIGLLLELYTEQCIASVVVLYVQIGRLNW